MNLYGIGEKETDNFGRQCLMARRLVEAGVRFVQITDGGWDHHGKLRDALPVRCKAVDNPIAGLIAGLKGRGLLDDVAGGTPRWFSRSPLDVGKTRNRRILRRANNPFPLRV